MLLSIQEYSVNSVVISCFRKDSVFPLNNCTHLAFTKFKSKIFLSVFPILVALGLSACEADQVKPRSGQNSNSISELEFSPWPLPDSICSFRDTLDLVNAAGKQLVDYCVPGPCPEASPNWGTVEIFNSPQDLVLNFRLAEGWYLEKYAGFAGKEAKIKFKKGLALVDSSWQQPEVLLGEGGGQLRVALADLDKCFEFSTLIGVVKMDPNPSLGIDESSRTTLMLHNKYWQDSSRTDLNCSASVVYRWCKGSCEPPVEILSLSKGDCHRCESQIKVDFYDCDSIKVSSCKIIDQLDLVFTDCNREVIKQPGITKGTFKGSRKNSNKEISHCFIKSGCFPKPDIAANGQRFDGPCLNKECQKRE